MLLLREHSLTAIGRMRPYSMKLDLSERGSTASPEVAGTETPPAVGAWMKSRSGPAAGIVWRVKSVEDSRYVGETYLVQLEHIISTLKDKILPGEVKPAQITGNRNATECTAQQAINYILSRQRDWRLGTLEVNATEPYSFHGENLFSALETVCSTLPDVYWDYDLTRYPFVLNIRRIRTDVQSEMRLNRNITGKIKSIVDRTGMYTRIYPIGKNNLKLPEESLSQNTGLYGEIEHPETDQSIDTVEALRAWARNRLRRHCEPKVTVTVAGLWLAQATGESLDSLTLNRTCRIPLPKYGTKIQERITKLSWSDCVREPEAVTVTLANNMTDVASIIKSISQSSGRSGRISAEKAEEDHAWFEDTTEHVAMVAEAIIGQSPDGIDWARVSEVIVDGEGIHQRVTKTEGDIVVAQTAIEENEESIRLEATRAAEAEGELSGRITVAADAITAEVKRASDAEGELSGRITVAADAITAEVKRASDAEGELSGRITVTAEAVTTEVQRASEAEGALSGRITVTADAITTEVERAQGAESSLSGRISTEAGKIALVVEETAGGNVIKAASIVTAVNNSGSSVAISADHVSITGDTKLSGAMMIDGGALVVKKSAVFQGNVTLQDANGILEAKSHVVKSGGHVRFTGTGAGEYYDLTGTNIQNFIKKAAVSGNTLQLWKFTDADATPSITFSKATSLSGAWSGNRFTVTASPQGNTCSADITHTAPYKDSQDSNKWKVRVYATDPSKSGTPPTEFNPPLNHYITLQSYLSNAYDGSDASHKITANGSYSPSAGMIGFSSVQVDVAAPSANAWLTAADAEFNYQGYLQYDQLYGVTLNGDVVATWRTGPKGTHSPTIDDVYTTRDTPSGATQLDSLKNQYEGAKDTGEYFCIRVDCNGTKKTYYCKP